mmetsp:Transcript_36540/g.57058  ORF Transcript_36540/g.57058 Transcript_36540/m.57058 type:complete len:333 (+) Transcript_36540:512-1510(+)
MFGDKMEEEALNSDWGLFPRIVKDIFMAMESRSVPFIVKASGVEFYLGEAFDMLNMHAQCQIDPDTGQPLGLLDITIQSVDGGLQFLKKIRDGRKTMGHAANDTSSRSHCAILISLYQISKSSKEEFCKTTLHLMDLAGAERPRATGQGRLSGPEASEAILKAMIQGQEIPLAAQGFVINYELSGIMDEVVSATERHKKGMPYQPQRQLRTAAIQYLTGCFRGETVLSSVVCLSQAGQFGWETWFSIAEYGYKLSQLRVPVKVQPAKQLKRTIQSLEKGVDEKKVDVARTDKANKYYPRKAGQLQLLERELRNLSDLSATFSSSGFVNTPRV